MRAVLLLSVLALARAATADCGPSCGPLLCNDRATLVVGTLEADPADASRRQLSVASVLRVVGTRQPVASERLPGWSGTLARAGTVIGYYEGADLSIPMGIFPVGVDGNVHCSGWGESTSAPEGRGVGPETLTGLLTLGSRECQEQLARAGYATPPPCDDSGCSFARSGRLPSIGMVVLLALIVRRRRRPAL